MTAREKGAAGILFVTGPLTETEEDLGGFRFDTSFADSGIPAAVIKRSFAEELLRPTGQSLSDLQTTIAHTGPHSMPLPGAAATITCTVVRERRETDNVLGFLEGSDPRLREETIVIGAHYDHLGLGGEGSRARESGPAIHHGADDNASGVAGLIELAEYFGAQRPRPPRSLLFAAFSGEELGLLGSAYYVKHPPVPLEHTVAMINMDMIGRARGSVLTVIGSGTSPAWKELLDAANADLVGAHEGAPLQLRPSASGFGASDQSSFYARDIPVLFFFTGVHKDYHMPSDTWEKINIVGEARIVRFVAAVIERIAGLPERPRFARAESEGPTMASPGFGVYLGTIPDYSEQGEGVTLSGVREGSPAEKGGLRAGDVIVQFGAKTVKNVYDYTYALRDAKAGEPVEVVVLRHGERQTLRVVPEKRRS
jgi:aminopeptidase YwaD